MKDNLFLTQSELIKVETKILKMAEKYKEYKPNLTEIANYIEEQRNTIEKETK